jgi:tRNA(Phe) wybutosine-synthesizing methylase Tyw3
MARRVLDLAEEYKVLMPFRSPPLMHIFMVHHDLDSALRLLRLGHSLGHKQVAGIQLNLIRMLLTEGRLDLCLRLYRGFPRVGEEHNSRGVLEVGRSR